MQLTKAQDVVTNAYRGQRGGRKRSPNDMFFAVSVNKSSKNPVCTIMPGSDIVRQLQWKAGDPVDIRFDNGHYWIAKDDLHGVEASESPWHFTKIHKTSNLLKVSFTIVRPMPFWNLYKSIHSTKTKWRHQDGGILITLPE